MTWISTALHGNLKITCNGKDLIPGDYHITYINGNTIIVFTNGFSDGDKIEIKSDKNNFTEIYVCRNGLLYLSVYMIKGNFTFPDVVSLPSGDFSVTTWHKKPQKEPLNNDGRQVCFWCGASTKKILSFSSSYDVCSVCGK